MIVFSLCLVSFLVIAVVIGAVLALSWLHAVQMVFLQLSSADLPALLDLVCLDYPCLSVFIAIQCVDDGDGDDMYTV